MNSAKGNPVLYWAAGLGALAVLVIEILTSFTTLGTIALFALVAIAVFTRPGGVFRRT